ncbi:MAG: type II toxin-antitoxin system prevent-host-death family antitoxin [Gaiella sp.]|nr:type II toxin-antitoxin system prevent-host-death family antitoxin [Gaiella sp.]
MATMGVRELRDTLTQVLRRVEAGERIEVTRDGEPIAAIVPLAEDPIARLVAEGRARPPLRPFRVPDVSRLPRAKARSLTEIVLEGREERLS